MHTLFDHIKQIETQDTRQKGKNKHKLDDIVGVALFATITNAEDCVVTEKLWRSIPNYKPTSP